MTAISPAVPTPQVAEESLSIVIRGAFNPPMFLPQFFRDAELLGELELEATEIEAITPELTSLRVGWAKIDVTQDTFQLRTEQIEEYTRLRDLAVGTLRILEHHPISVIGTNHETHTLLASKEQLHRLGDVLAPKVVWDPILKLAGMRSVQMWGARDDGWQGRLQVVVEPSVRHSPAFFLSVNNHFELERAAQLPSTRDGAFGEGTVATTPEKRQRAIDVLLEEWDNISVQSQDVYDGIVSITQREGM